jgi:hypothetical protein
MECITDIQVDLKAFQILKGQGIDPERAGPHLKAPAEAAAEEARALIAPAALLGTFPVESFHHQRIELAGGEAFEGPLAARVLAGSRETGLAVCTIGPALEERIAGVFQEDPVTALALEGAGIAALQQVSGAAERRIREAASSKGWGSGMRAQPGQEGWPIEQQAVVFDLLPAERIHVRLTGSALMLPRQSVSLVIGMGPDMRPDGVACDLCSKRGRCPWRIRGEHSG